MEPFNCAPSLFKPASRVHNIPRSGIRELLSNAPGKKLISFGGGVPHDSCIPLIQVESAFEKVMSRYGTQAFRYGSSEGEPELRQQVSDWLCKLGIKSNPEQVLIVNGSQQALDLLGKVLIDPGSPVLVERPTYLAALQAFSAYDPRYHEVSMDEKGPVSADLDDKLKTADPRFFYTIPSFQNPSGTCCSVERRFELAETINDNDCLLIEDDPYSQLYYDTPTPPPISSLGVNKAIFLGTFSKMVAPGFRLGWVWSNTEVLRHLVTVKQAADLCTGRFQQLLLSELLSSLNMEEHLAKNRSFYTGQRDRMNAMMTSFLGDHLQWSKPEGGMFFWAKLNSGKSAEALLNRTIQRGVAFADGASFFANNKERNFLRLNFTQATETDMNEGLKVLKEEIESL